MIRPHQTLLFLLGVGAISIALMFVVPKGGIDVLGVSLRYPTWEEFVASDTAQVVDMDAILRASHMTRLDTAGQAKSEAEKRAREKLLRTLELRKLQFAASDTLRLRKFKAALNGLGSNGRVRVLHFGDSQIEGDRITSFLREEWQEEYGGNGPGMLAVTPLAPNFSIRQSNSENWNRYTAFGRRDSNITHSDYGYRAVLCRYTPPLLDTALSDTTMGWLEFRPSVQGYSHVRQYSRMRLYFGKNRKAVRLSVYVNDTLYTEEIVQANTQLLSRTWNFTATPKVIRFEFEGSDSPDVYGLTLEGNSGVTVDNIAMRGASGVVFTRMSRASFASMVGTEPVHLIIYQYGGNTVPYIKDEEHAQQYARRVRRQIQRLKVLAPEAAIVMVGPSDMSRKEGTSYVTYDAVPWVRNELRKVALSENVGFWDIYGAMGGLNSMPEWVSAKPPLAGQDYIHFTPRGARQVATWMYEAFEREMYPERYADTTDVQPDTTAIP